MHSGQIGYFVIYIIPYSAYLFTLNLRWLGGFLMVEKNLRARQWTFIVYPDSAPEGWEDWLASKGFRALISPLHNKDKNPDGSVKKPHWHVLLVFNGKKSWKQVTAITEHLHSPIPEILRGDGTGMARYFLHLDNPEKHRYSKDDMKSIGGLDIESFLAPTITDQHNLLEEIFDFIAKHEISNLMVLIGCAKRLKRQDWIDMISNKNTLVITQMLNAQYHRLQLPKEKRKTLEKEVDQALNHVDGDDKSFMSMFGDGTSGNKGEDKNSNNNDDDDDYEDGEELFMGDENDN